MGRIVLCHATERKLVVCHLQHWLLAWGPMAEAVDPDDVAPTLGGAPQIDQQALGAGLQVARCEPAGKGCVVERPPAAAGVHRM